MSDIDKYYQILGLNPGVSEKEIVEAYKVLVKVWNPDRFSDDPNIRRIATEKIKEIDEAFKQLLIWAGSPPGKVRETPKPELEARTGRPETKRGIVIQTEPEGAVIAINGELVGISPYEGVELPSGYYKVRATLQEHEIWEKDVYVKAGAKQEVLAKLKLKEPESRKEKKEQPIISKCETYGDTLPGVTHLMEVQAQIASESKKYGTPRPSLQEPPHIIEYAGFWKRLMALVIDSILIYVVTFIVCFIFRFSIGLSGRGISEVTVTGWILGIIIYWFYWALMESSSKQATLGKMALSIIVTDLEGKRISFGKATGRYWGKIISGLILCFGYIMAGFTEKKQALHDMMAGCLVVVK